MGQHTGGNECALTSVGAAALLSSLFPFVCTRGIRPGFRKTRLVAQLQVGAPSNRGCLSWLNVSLFPSLQAVLASARFCQVRPHTASRLKLPRISIEREGGFHFRFGGAALCRATSVYGLKFDFGTEL